MSALLSEKKLRRAYCDALLAVHPDRLFGVSSELQKLGAQIFDVLTVARKSVVH